jgi:hypothetical protein
LRSNVTPKIENALKRSAPGITCVRSKCYIRAYIETLLSYGPAAKESQLTGVMWYKDTPGHQDKTTADNKGCTARKALTNVHSAIQCSIIVSHDLCFHKQVSISQVDIVVPR